MTTVFVVERGEYSDYRVVGVFTTRENAQKIADLVADDATVAEWSLDPAIDELSTGRWPYLVIMRIDGTVERVERKQLSSYDLTGEIRIWERSKAPFYKNTNTPDAMMATVWATDDRHAIKIVNEHRTQWIAEGKWS